MYCMYPWTIVISLVDQTTPLPSEFCCVYVILN